MPSSGSCCFEKNCRVSRATGLPAACCYIALTFTLTFCKEARQLRGQTRWCEPRGGKSAAARHGKLF